MKKPKKKHSFYSILDQIYNKGYNDCWNEREKWLKSNLERKERMSIEYNPNLLETDLKGHIVTNVDVWSNGKRLTIRTDKGAYIDFYPVLTVTENGIFVDLKRINRWSY